MRNAESGKVEHIKRNDMKKRRKHKHKQTDILNDSMKCSSIKMYLISN